MGKPNRRYCVRSFNGKWRIWDRKMKKWWGLPSNEFPSENIDRLNSKKKKK